MAAIENTAQMTLELLGALKRAVNTLCSEEAIGLSAQLPGSGPSASSEKASTPQEIKSAFVLWLGNDDCLVAAATLVDNDYRLRMLPLDVAISATGSREMKDGNLKMPFYKNAAHDDWQLATKDIEQQTETSKENWSPSIWAGDDPGQRRVQTELLSALVLNIVTQNKEKLVGLDAAIVGIPADTDRQQFSQEWNRAVSALPKRLLTEKNDAIKSLLKQAIIEELPPGNPLFALLRRKEPPREGSQLLLLDGRKTLKGRISDYEIERVKDEGWFDPANMYAIGVKSENKLGKVPSGYYYYSSKDVLEADSRVYSLLNRLRMPHIQLMSLQKKLDKKRLKAMELEKRISRLSAAKNRLQYLIDRWAPTSNETGRVA